MHLEVYLSFVLAATILIIIPGPTLLTIVSHTIRYGTKRATHSILGASLAHLLFVIIVAFGINKLLLLSIEYFFIIKWIGVLYLLFLGLRQFLAKPNSQRFSVPKKGQSSLFLQAFFVTITNPKSILFYGAFFPPFLNPFAPLLLQYVTLGATFILLFIILSTLFSVFSGKITGLLAENSNATIIRKVSGSLMVGASILLASVKSSTR